MRRRVHDLRECVKVALADLHTDIAPLSSEHYEIIAGCLRVPSIFNDTTGKLLEEKRGSSSNFSHSEVLQGKAGDAGKRLNSEYTAVIRNSVLPPPPHHYNPIYQKHFSLWINVYGYILIILLYLVTWSLFALVANVIWTPQYCRWGTVLWKRCYFCLQINKCCPYFTCNMSLIIKAHSHHNFLPSLFPPHS